MCKFLSSKFRQVCTLDMHLRHGWTMMNTIHGASRSQHTISFLCLACLRDTVGAGFGRVSRSSYIPTSTLNESFLYDFTQIDDFIFQCLILGNLKLPGATLLEVGSMPSSISDVGVPLDSHWCPIGKFCGFGVHWNTKWSHWAYWACCSAGFLMHYIHTKHQATWQNLAMKIHENGQCDKHSASFWAFCRVARMSFAWITTWRRTRRHDDTTRLRYLRFDIFDCFRVDNCWYDDRNHRNQNS